MRPDEIDGILRDILREEVASAVARLDGLEEQIVLELGDRSPRLRFVDWVRGLTAPTRAGRVGQLAVLGATAALFLVVGDVLLADQHLPGVRADQAGHDVEAGGLAGAVGALSLIHI